MNRCQAIHPKQGKQCGLPEGHIGQHANGTIVQPWGFPTISKPSPVYVGDEKEEGVWD